MQPAGTTSESQDPATAAFRSKLPFILQPISPSLAALHVTRARLQDLPEGSQDAFSSTHCPQCGSYMLHGDAITRILHSRSRIKVAQGRLAHSTSVRYVQRVCRVCEHVQNVPIEHGGASHYPSVRRRAAGKTRAPSPARKAVPVVHPSKSSVRASTGPSQPSSALSSAPSSRAPSVHPPTQPSTPKTNTPIPTRSVKSSEAVSGPPEPHRSKARPKKKTGLQDMLARNRERQERDKQSGASGGLAAFLEGL